MLPIGPSPTSSSLFITFSLKCLFSPTLKRMSPSYLGLVVDTVTETINLSMAEISFLHLGKLRGLAQGASRWLDESPLLEFFVFIATLHGRNLLGAPLSGLVRCWQHESFPVDSTPVTWSSFKYLHLRGEDMNWSCFSEKTERKKKRAENQEGTQGGREKEGRGRETSHSCVLEKCVFLFITLLISN